MISAKSSALIAVRTEDIGGVVALAERGGDGGVGDDVSDASVPGKVCAFRAELLAPAFLAAVGVCGWAELGIGVCFPQAGQFLFLDAAFSPRGHRAVCLHSGWLDRRRL